MSVNMVVSVILYLTIAIVTIAMARQVQTSAISNRVGLLNRAYMLGIFAILFLCSGLRFGVGNDYINYAETAHEAYVGGYVVTEIGFNKIVSFIYWLFGGEYYEIVFAIFAFVTLIIFLKTMYEQSVDFSFTFFLFMTMGLYFQTFNTMRYYLALGITLYSIRYVLSKDYIRFIFVIVIAALFHKSVLIVIPIYIIASLRWRMWQIVAGIIISAGCYGGKSVLLKLALKLYPSYNNTEYLAGGTSLTSIVRGIIIIIFFLWYYYRYIFDVKDYSVDIENTSAATQRDFLERKKDKTRSRFAKLRAKKSNWKIEEKTKYELRLYVQLNLLSIVVYTFFSFLPVITRIGYYLSACQIFIIPLIVKNIPDENEKEIVKGIIVIASVLYFMAFLATASKPGVGLLPYQSWLFMSERLHYN